MRGFIIMDNYEGLITLPQRATSGSAGYDIKAVNNFVIEPATSYIAPTGLKIYMNTNEECQIRSRSGLAAKHGIIVLNSPGTIDSDYEDELKVILYNTSEMPYRVSAGDRIAQAIFSTYLVSEDDRPIKERTGGFGSTGV